MLFANFVGRCTITTPAIDVIGGYFMHHKHRLFVSAFLILLALLMLSACHGGTTEPEEKPLLSSLSEEECRQVLADYGVTIPEQFQDVMFQKMMTNFENNLELSYKNALGLTDLADFSEEVRTVVRAYHGLDTEN